MTQADLTEQDEKDLEILHRPDTSMDTVRDAIPEKDRPQVVAVTVFIEHEDGRKYLHQGLLAERATARPSSRYRNAIKLSLEIHEQTYWEGKTDLTLMEPITGSTDEDAQGPAETEAAS